MKKRIISMILMIAVIAASFSFAYTAFARSIELILDLRMSTVIDGKDDLEWFYYTPAVSGTYSLTSLNNYASEGYLFVKEVNPTTKQKEYVQLAYSNKDETSTDPGNRQFRLTYHLEAGTKYYYAVGWYLSETRTNGTYSIILTNDSYDASNILRIELGEPPSLEAYTNGNWVTDANGNEFFRYNITRIIANLSITIYYDDGTSSTVVGKDYIDGYPLTFVDPQYTDHWYPNESEEYTANIFTVKLGNLSASINIPILITSKYSFKGKIVDMNGVPIENASIFQNTSKLGVTDSNGLFSVYTSSGKYDFTFETSHSIKRTVSFQISAINANNDFTSTPIEICNCEFVKDGIINAKDFAIINKYPASDEKQILTDEFHSCILFTKNDYV